MEFSDLLVIVISFLRALAWIVGGCIVWKYGRKVPRLVRPTYFLAPAMFLSGVNSFIFTLTLNQTFTIEIPRWIEATSQVLATPILLVVIGGIVYPWLNAFVLQANDNRLESRAREDASEFIRELDKR